MKYLFGPVPSRRLGYSLGIDIIPFKTCTLDCIYCECGRTTLKTVKRKPYVRKDAVIEELKEFLERNIYFEIITFSGSGEPTLNNEIGKMIKEIKKITNKRVAVLTNGTLLYLKEVQYDLLEADIILPSLDAAEKISFMKINRPAIELELDEIINGLIEFRKVYEKEIWLEILFVKGINDSKKNINKLIDVCHKIEPDLIQLNTIDRPAAEEFAKPISESEMIKIKEMFISNELNAEIIKNFTRTHKRTRKEILNLEEMIINFLKRRPETADDIANALNIHINNVNKILSILLEKKLIKSEQNNKKTYYKIIFKEA